MRVSSSLLALALYLAGSFAAPAVDTNVGGVNRRLLDILKGLPIVGGLLGWHHGSPNSENQDQSNIPVSDVGGAEPAE
ncbi:hypothetical protein OG21DRAFT_1500156 [Imleria badia]|nr:hypothetical protein OG21DRAFT_1500156 [Imleria badia]